MRRAVQTGQRYPFPWGEAEPRSTGTQRHANGAIRHKLAAMGLCMAGQNRQIGSASRTLSESSGWGGAGMAVQGAVVAQWGCYGLVATGKPGHPQQT